MRKLTKVLLLLALSFGMVIAINNLGGAEVHTYISGAYDNDNKSIQKTITILRNADSNTTVYMHLQTPGGSVITAFQLLNAMDESKATIVTVADGAAISAGFMTLISADRMEVAKHGLVLAHLARYQMSWTKICIPNLNDPMQGTVANILANNSNLLFTEEEVINMLWGADIGLFNSEFKKRLDNPLKGNLITSKRFLELLKKEASIQKDLNKPCITPGMRDAYLTEADPKEEKSDNTITIITVDIDY